MTLPLAVLWIAVISLFGAGAAWYAKRSGRPDALIGLYVTLVIFSNIVASKVIEFDFGFKTFFAPGAVLAFSVTFLLTDIVNERFGKRETLKMIFLAFLCQAAFVVFSMMTLRAKDAPFFQNQAAFEAVLGVVPRIVVASLLAFLASEAIDAHLFHWFRKLTGGRRLWMRNAFSTLPAMMVDSLLFVTLAFGGTMPLLPLMIGLTVTKWVVGLVDIPFMYLSRHILGKDYVRPEA